MPALPTAPRRPRIAHVIYDLGIGGGEIFLLELVRAMDRDRFEQTVYCVGSRGRLSEDVEAAGVPVVAFRKATRLGAVTISRLARRIRSDCPDVLQTHGEGGLFWGLPAARLARVRATCSLLYHMRATHAQRLVAGRLLHLADVVLAGSDTTRRFVIQSLGISSRRVRTIACGLDLARFAGGRSQPKADAPPVIVSIGRLVALKGHAILLRAFAEVYRRHPDATLWIAGDGPLRAELEGLAAGLGLGPAVRLLGTTYPTMDLLRQATIFAFPSIEESQGLAPIEACATGLPIVASRTGGIVDTIENGRSGVLVEPGDVDDLARALLGLIANPEQCAELGRNAARGVQRFDIRHIAPQYERLYDALADRMTPVSASIELNT